MEDINEKHYSSSTYVHTKCQISSSDTDKVTDQQIWGIEKTAFLASLRKLLPSEVATASAGFGGHVLVALICDFLREKSNQLPDGRVPSRRNPLRLTTPALSVYNTFSVLELGG